MTICRAFLLASGLLLGFSLFSSYADLSSSLSDTIETSEAFLCARQVLLHFAELSPQARHYHEILTSFSDAVDKFKQQRSKLRKRKRGQLLDEIFTFDAPSTNGDTAATPAPHLTPSEAGASGSSDTFVNSVVDTSFPTTSFGGDPMSAIDGFAANFDFDVNFGLPGFSADDATHLPMLWDDFSADWLPDGGMTCDGN